MAQQEKSVENSVCLNHPDRPATKRCTVCFKPICDECAMQEDQGVFCSSECRENFNSSREGVAEFQAKAAARRKAKAQRRLVILFLIAVVAYFAWRWYKSNPDKFEELKGKAQEMSEEAEKKAKELAK